MKKRSVDGKPKDQKDFIWFQYVEEKYFDNISRCNTAKEAWDLAERNYRGAEKIKKKYEWILLMENLKHWK